MTKYQIITPHTFLNELLGLPAKIQKTVLQKVKVLERDPISAQGDAKKLKNRVPPLYRVRIGDYRLIYTFDAGWVKLIAIRKRDDQTYQHDFGQIDLPEESPPDVSFLRVPVPPAPPPSEPAVVTTQPLTREVTAADLQQWRIPEQYWPALLAVRTEDDLLNAPVPQAIMERVLDILYPRRVDEILQQPQYLLNDAEDLDRFVAGELTDFLLMLDPEQQRLVETPLDKPVLVRGGPGTGKSIVALYRVQRLVASGQTPVLFTTFTNALISYSTQLLERLLQGDLAAKGVEVNTVDSVIFRQYARAYGSPRFAPEGELLNALHKALAIAPMAGDNEADRQHRREALQTLGVEYLLDEFTSVIEHWGLTTYEAYASQPRIGRKLPLRASLREAVWSVYETWSHLLRQQGWTTWGNVRRQALELARHQPARPYRAIVIDEAQDLSPVALRYLLACVESPQSIYVTADAGQSLYQRGFSWQQIDGALQMRGRSFVLRRNYRNTAQIAAACASILGIAGDNDQAAAIHNGNVPTIQFCRDITEEALAIRDFFAAAARRWRLPPHTGAVLCHSKQVAQHICAQLNQLGVPAEFMERKQIDIRKPVVKVMTLHSAKGLEFPFVAITRLAQEHLPHNFDHLPPEEREEAIAQERRLFYVGCSRAMRELLVCASADQPSSFVQALPATLWQRIEP